MDVNQNIVDENLKDSTGEENTSEIKPNDNELFGRFSKGVALY